MRRALAVLVLAAAPLVAAPVLAQDAPPRQIVVTGEGRSAAAPDMATVTVGVQAEATEASAALAAANAAMTKVFAALEAAGIARADMQTSQLSVDPLWSETDGQTPPAIRGYGASNLVTVRVRDVSRVGAVIDAVGGAGANRVVGVAFGLADPRRALDAARIEAVEDARARATLLAEASGVELGEVVSIREQGFAAPGPMFARAEMAMDAPAPVAEGTIDLQASVEMVYAIR